MRCVAMWYASCCAAHAEGGQKKQGTDDEVVAPCITPKNQLKTSYAAFIPKILPKFILNGKTNLQKNQYPFQYFCVESRNFRKIFQFSCKIIYCIGKNKKTFHL